MLDLLMMEVVLEEGEGELSLRLRSACSVVLWFGAVEGRLHLVK